MMISHSTKTIFTFIVSCVISSVSSSSKEIIFAGDSDISRWKNTDEIYENSVNVGEGGTTCQQWVKRIGNTFDKYSLTTVVVLVCGENDLDNRYMRIKYLKIFVKFVETIYAKGVDRVIYIGTKPEPDTKSLHVDYCEYDGMIRNYYVDAEPDGKFTMVDVYPSFIAMGI